MSWVIKHLYHNFQVDSQNYQPLDTVNHLTNYRPGPSASCDGSSCGPQHIGANNFDCRPERYEIVVCWPTSARYVLHVYFSLKSLLVIRKKNHNFCCTEHAILIHFMYFTLWSTYKLSLKVYPKQLLGLTILVHTSIR